MNDISKDMKLAANPRKINHLLDKYGESHQNKVNKTIHWICVPLIFFSIFGLIRCIPLPNLMEQIPYLSWASILLGITLLYYLFLSPLLFAGFVVFGGWVALGNEYLYQYGTLYLLLFSTSVFVLAWIGQFIGHEIEGKKPSFLKDVQFLLIGPAWLMHFLYKRAGISC